MKFKTKNKIRNLLITTSLLAVSIPALALKTDTSQPMTITSDNQAVDINSNTVTLTGNVVVKQGSILVHADRATIVRPNGQSGKEVVEVGVGPHPARKRKPGGSLPWGDLPLNSLVAAFTRARARRPSTASKRPPCCA